MGSEVEGPVRPPNNPNVEFVCTGATIQYGHSQGNSMIVIETPREVRECIRDAEEDLVELHHHGDREVPQYVDRRRIIAIHPYWTEVE